MNNCPLFSRQRNEGCTRKQRSAVSIVIAFLIFAGIVCAIVIPLVLNANRAKTDDPPASTASSSSVTDEIYSKIVLIRLLTIDPSLI